MRQLYLDTLKDWPQDELPTHRSTSARRPRPRRRPPRRRLRRRQKSRRCRPRRPPPRRLRRRRLRPKRETGEEGSQVKVTDESLTASARPTTRWSWRRCPHQPNARCSTAGSQRRGNGIPTRASRCCSCPATTTHRPRVRSARRTARGRRRPVRRSRAGVLGARRSAHPVQGGVPLSAGGTPTGRRSCCSAASFGRTRHAPGSSTANRPRSPNCGTVERHHRRREPS